MRLTVLFEPRPWIKRRACSRSRTVAPVLHYFRVLRGVLRHHWPKKRESIHLLLGCFFCCWPFCIIDRCALPWRIKLCLLFRAQLLSTAYTFGASVPICRKRKAGYSLSTSFEKTCMRQFHTFPWMMWLTLIQACIMTKASLTQHE